MKRRRYKIDDVNNPVFVTTTITGWIPIFADGEMALAVLNTLEDTRQEFNVSIMAFVLMPSHFHGIFRGHCKGNVSRIMQRWKSRTSRLILNKAKASQPLWLEQFKESASLYNCSDRQSHQVWTPRFDCVSIESEDQFYAALEYIHNNPIKSQLVTELANYPYSSYHDYADKDNGYIKIDRALRHSRSEQALTRKGITTRISMRNL